MVAALFHIIGVASIKVFYIDLFVGRVSGSSLEHLRLKRVRVPPCSVRGCTVNWSFIDSPRRC